MRVKADDGGSARGRRAGAVLDWGCNGPVAVMASLVSAPARSVSRSYLAHPSWAHPGCGRDIYVLSQLVGASARAVGVDMTEEQLAVAERHRADHRDTFGFAHENAVQCENSSSKKACIRAQERASACASYWRFSIP